MPIRVPCPHCHAELNVPDSLAGQLGRCAACKNVLSIPALDVPILPLAEPAPPKLAPLELPPLPPPAYVPPPPAYVPPVDVPLPMAVPLDLPPPPPAYVPPPVEGALLVEDERPAPTEPDEIVDSEIDDTPDRTVPMDAEVLDDDVEELPNETAERESPRGIDLPYRSFADIHDDFLLGQTTDKIKRKSLRKERTAEEAKEARQSREDRRAFHAAGAGVNLYYYAGQVTFVGLSLGLLVFLVEGVTAALMVAKAFRTYSISEGEQEDFREALSEKGLSPVVRLETRQLADGRGAALGMAKSFRFTDLFASIGMLLFLGGSIATLVAMIFLVRAPAAHGLRGLAIGCVCCAGVHLLIYFVAMILMFAQGPVSFASFFHVAYNPLAFGLQGWNMGLLATSLGHQVGFFIYALPFLEVTRYTLFALFQGAAGKALKNEQLQTTGMLGVTTIPIGAFSMGLLLVLISLGTKHIASVWPALVLLAIYQLTVLALMSWHNFSTLTLRDALEEV